MNQIKFSHYYYKLEDIANTATLIGVSPITINKNTSSILLDYDTTYEGGRYELKNGEYLLLMFIDKNKKLFTTIRPKWNGYGDKEQYYRNKINQEFAIVFTEEK